jgi:hypothetical protein
MRWSLQEVGHRCGPLLTRNYERQTRHVHRAIDRRHDHIEFRTFLGTGQDGSNGMKERLALEAGAIFDAIGRGAERVAVEQRRSIE